MNLTPLKTHKLFFLSQISLRVFAAAATLAAAWIMLTAKQTSVVFGIQLDARYSYTPAFKYTNLPPIFPFLISNFNFLPLFLTFN